MSKPLIPSRTLLSSFSRCLRPQGQAKLFRSASSIATTRGRGGVVPLMMCRRTEGLREERGIEGGRMGEGQKRGYKTVEEAKSRYKSGPFSWKAGAIFLLSGATLIIYFRYEKARMERIRIANATKGVGRPKVGGPFSLIDQDGQPFSHEKLLGRYSLVYFGFSHCPDICPEELDKMAEMIDLVNSSPVLKKSGLPPLLPVFITCDPARDTPAVLKEYLREFHKDIVGLTGSWEEIKDVCKKYRVYFSTPQGVEKGQDYLVDHSIYFYLMDPEGDFVEAIGRQFSPEGARTVVEGHVADWKASGK